MLSFYGQKPVFSEYCLSFIFEWNVIRLGGPTHGIVIVCKTLSVGGRGQRG